MRPPIHRPRGELRTVVRHDPFRRPQHFPQFFQRPDHPPPVRQLAAHEIRRPDLVHPPRLDQRLPIPARRPLPQSPAHLQPGRPIEPLNSLVVVPKPWAPLAVAAVSVVWSRRAYRKIRDTRLVFVPLFNIAVMYVFTLYYLRGLILGRAQVTLHRAAS